jgi:hypothetical protein
MKTTLPNVGFFVGGSLHFAALVVPFLSIAWFPGDPHLAIASMLIIAVTLPLLIYGAHATWEMIQREEANALQEETGPIGPTRETTIRIGIPAAVGRPAGCFHCRKECGQGSFVLCGPGCLRDCIDEALRLNQPVLARMLERERDEALAELAKLKGPEPS